MSELGIDLPGPSAVSSENTLQQFMEAHPRTIAEVAIESGSANFE